MRKILTSIAVAFFLFAAKPILASGFLSFDQQIRVGPASILTIQERVSVDFPTPRHGIFRDIPVKYKTEAGNPFNLRVNVLSVYDDAGNALDYSVSQVDDNERVKNERIKIGDANQTVTGRQTYVITYAVSRALLYFSDHDELYWNAIVGEWGDLGMPEKTNVTVILPDGVPAEKITTRCFTQVGSNADGNCQKNASSSSAQFSTEGTALTVVVGWPKNVVAAAAPTQQIKDWFADNWIIFWPIVVFAGLFVLWFKKGRDPKVRQPIVVQYEPPEAASPAEVGALAKERVDMAEITATIIHLAVRGYLNIVEKTDSGFLGKEKSYSFELKNNNQKGLTAYEAEIMNGLFGSSAVGTTVSVSDLKTTFYSTVAFAKKSVERATVERAWFSKNPTAVRAVYIGIGFAYLFVIVFFGRSSLAGAVWILSLFLPAVFLFFFGYYMPARTMKGTEAYAYVLGFKEYLSKAEKYRLKWAEKENIFENYLPYAMAFGVVDKWAKAFEGLNIQPPSWYRGGNMNVWSPMLFAQSLNTASSAIGHNLATAPSSKSGGGFGGGGFGGGGFGGGGGGSW